MVGLFFEITFAEPREWVKEDPFAMATLPITRTIMQTLCVIGFGLWVKVAAFTYYYFKDKNKKL